MKVFCKSCERIIGLLEIKPDSRVVYKKLSGILSARMRFDGNWGFQCACGNDSRLCAAEKGIVGANPPTKTDMEKIHAQLEKQSDPCTLTKDGYDCDGFIWSN